MWRRGGGGGGERRSGGGGGKTIEIRDKSLGAALSFLFQSPSQLPAQDQSTKMAHHLPKLRRCSCQEGSWQLSSPSLGRTSLHGYLKLLERDLSGATPDAQNGDAVYHSLLFSCVGPRSKMLAGFHKRQSFPNMSRPHLPCMHPWKLPLFHFNFPCLRLPPARPKAVVRQERVVHGCYCYAMLRAHDQAERSLSGRRTGEQVPPLPRTQTCLNTLLLY